jgi:hypothetical protein
MRTSNPAGPLSTGATTLVAAPDTSTQIVLSFDDNRLASALFGQYGQNLALIERRLGVGATSRGNQVTLQGTREACEQARRVLDGLYERLKRGDELVQGDVDGTIRMTLSQGSLFDFDPASARENFEEINLRKRRVRAPAPRRRMLMCARSSAMRSFSPPDRPAPARPGWRWRRQCSCSSARTSIASFCRAPRSKPASGSASCPATCARKSIRICGRFTTRFTI